MKRNILIIVGAILLLAVPAVLAQEVVGGTGTLTAWGDGSAAIRGNGTVNIAGNGVLYVMDRAGDAEIMVSGNGERTEREYYGHTVLIYRGFDGEATISGSHIGVLLRGKDIHLTAEGTGHVVLKGEGEYTVNGETYSWTTDGVVVKLGNH